MEQKCRETADEELVAFLSEANNYNIIFFDTETNGLPKNGKYPSLLSISAIRGCIAGKSLLSQVQRYNRFYFSREEPDPNAIKVNGLTEDVINEKRGTENIPFFFDEDFGAFQSFCKGVDLFVGHNAIDFDTKFIPCINWSTKKIFDTMHCNADIVCAEWMKTGHYDHGIYVKEPGWKRPKLLETAKFYKIPLEEKELHGSMYDAQLTMTVFFEMLKKSNLRLKKFQLWGI
jgi:DNA polymerase III subunit epsilon